MRYRRRTIEVEGLQNDGTDQRAIELESWINSHGGNAVAILTGTIDYAQNAAFIKIIDSARPQNLVGPGAWVVMVNPGEFFAVTHDEFEILYAPITTEGTPES